MDLWLLFIITTPIKIDAFELVKWLALNSCTWCITFVLLETGSLVTNPFSKLWVLSRYFTMAIFFFVCTQFFLENVIDGERWDCNINIFCLYADSTHESMIPRSIRTIRSPRSTRRRRRSPLKADFIEFLDSIEFSFVFPTVILKFCSCIIHPRSKRTVSFVLLRYVAVVMFAFVFRQFFL
jgi:hypothetical protein